MAEIIGGTVIQRSFVGREAANIIHVATVPLAELGIDSEEPRTIVSELLGIPRSNVLEDDNYRQIIDRLRHFPPDYFSPFWHPRTERYFQRIHDSLERKDDSNKDFLSDFLNTVSGGTAAGSFFQPWPVLLEPGFQKGLEVNPDVLALAMQCVASRAFRTRSSVEFVQQVLTYDIPLGQSPKVKADSLLELLETSKKMCVAPLALGGAQGVTQLTQGNYVAALLTTGTAGIMTLVLIGTVSVGTLIVQKVAQARAKNL